MALDVAKLFASYTQSSLHASAAKSIAMKPLADQVRDFMKAKGWDVRAMAKAADTSRQNIENVLAGRSSQPRYIAQLAAAMGTTVDTLLGVSAGGAVDVVAQQVDGSVLCIELKNMELDDTTLSREELQSLVVAVVDMPGVVARQWLARIAEEASVYREHEAQVIRRLGGTVPAPRGVTVRVEAMRRAHPPRPPIGEISPEALELVRAYHRIIDPAAGRQRQAQALQVLDGHLDSLLAGHGPARESARKPRSRAAKKSTAPASSVPTSTPEPGRRR